MEFKSAYLGTNKIIRAYKGDILFYEKQPDDYIQDGLVLFLDGLNQGDETDKWIDTINGREFLLTNTTKNNGFVTFNKGYARNADNTSFVTIELVMRIATNAANSLSIFTANGNGKNNIFRNRDYIGFGNTNASLGSPFTKGTTEVFSAIFDSTNNAYIEVYKNNQLQSGTAGDSWGTQNTGTNIGYYGSGSYAFSGDIFALRLYDRELTPTERAYNYELDIQRYGLNN